MSTKGDYYGTADTFYRRVRLLPRPRACPRHAIRTTRSAVLHTLCRAEPQGLHEGQLPLHGGPVPAPGLWRTSPFRIQQPHADPVVRGAAGFSRVLQKHLHGPPQYVHCGDPPRVHTHSPLRLRRAASPSRRRRGARPAAYGGTGKRTLRHDRRVLRHRQKNSST